MKLSEAKFGAEPNLNLPADLPPFRDFSQDSAWTEVILPEGKSRGERGRLMESVATLIIQDEAKNRESLVQKALNQSLLY